MKKQTNERKVLKALETHGAMTQATLAKIAKIKNVYQLVRRLIDEGKVSMLDGSKEIALNHTATEPTPKPKPKAPTPGFVDSTLLEYFEVEHARLTKEIEIKLHEYAYVTSQIKKLSDETR